MESIETLRTSVSKEFSDRNRVKSETSDFWDRGTYYFVALIEVVNKINQRKTP